jgi:NodT family efflux transporter outer membrane factor (OMF) lipoprotein
MKRTIASVIACSMLLFLPACIPILRRPQPAPELPETFRGETSSENTSQVGVDEFYSDPILLELIDQALSPEGNRELKILNEEVQIARNEILARSGAYLPFITAGALSGFNRYSRFTEQGAGILADPYLPGKFFGNPTGNYGAGLNFSWQLDIYRQLRNARDAAAQRYVVASERRNFFVTRLVADIAENYYGLMALDKRLENLNQIIEFQEQSLRIAIARKEAARGTELPVLRFQAELRRNFSEKLIVNQDIIEVENRINFLINRYPQAVTRASEGFYDLKIHDLSVGVPSELLQNRPDIRRAERELVAAGLDVQVARVNFYPQLVLTAGAGPESLIINHLFEPTAVVGNITGGLLGPLVNFRAIKAQYLTANARQLQAIYDYQRVILEAFTQVVNRLNMVKNYTNSIEIKKQQLQSLEAAVDVAGKLFQNARVEYLDVLLAQRDLRDARVVLIDTKREQLSAIVNAYQAVGGGVPPWLMAETAVILPPLPHHSGPPSPVAPPPGHGMPPGPLLPAGPLVPVGPPLADVPPLPPEPVTLPGPMTSPGPGNSPVKEKATTDLEPLPAKP